MAILIEPGGAQALYFMTRSCGHEWSKELLEVKKATSLRRLQGICPESEAFSSLEWYAKSNKLNRIGVLDVVRYYSGPHLIDANRSVKFRPELTTTTNNYVGKLLANCLLWPLEADGSFRCGGTVVSVQGAEDLGGQGHLFLHRGAVFRLQVDPKDVVAIKDSQTRNKLFVAALKRIGPRLILPIAPQP